MTDKTIRRKVEAITKKKLVEKKVVNIGEFRELKKAITTKTVLVVDDDEIMRNAFRRILEADGYRVFLAEDGLELSKIIETTRLDLLLLDINLPWVDGLELCRLIKSHNHFRATPLILVSARHSKEDIAAGFAAGATDYITKPFDVDHILNIVRQSFLQASMP